MSSDSTTPALPDLTQGSDFMRAAGLQVTEAGPGRVLGYVALGPEHHTPWGVVHGGVYASAVESAASIGAYLAVAEQGLIAVGVNNNTNFLRSVTAGRVNVVAEPIHQGRTQQLWEVRLTDDADRLVAIGQVRLQNVARRPQADGSARAQ